MAWFRCFIRGENFPGGEGSNGLVGFYTTRFVEADNADEAEMRGLESLWSHEWLASLRDHAQAGRARVFFEEIEQVLAETAPANPPGLVFFAMNDSPAVG